MYNQSSRTLATHLSERSEGYQPPPLLPHHIRTLLLIPVNITCISRPLQTLPRNLAVHPDILDQRLQRHIIVLRANIPQNQQLQLRPVEVGQFVEFHLPRAVCRWRRGGQRRHDVDFLESSLAYSSPSNTYYIKAWSARETDDRLCLILVERVIPDAQHSGQNRRFCSPCRRGRGRALTLLILELGWIKRNNSIVHPHLEIGILFQSLSGDIGRRDAQLSPSVTMSLCTSICLGKMYVGRLITTSLLPRPNPLITGPDRRTGYGGSGPLSGPATGSRGPSGRMARFGGPDGVVVVSRLGRVALFTFCCVSPGDRLAEKRSHDGLELLCMTDGNWSKNMAEDARIAPRTWRTTWGNICDGGSQM